MYLSILIGLVFTVGTANAQDVSLHAGHLSSRVGRAHVEFDGLHRVICSDNTFTQANAKVFCQQLGYTYNDATENAGIMPDFYTFDLNYSPYVPEQKRGIRNVQCTGSEARIQDCPRDAGFHLCGDDNTVGIACEIPTEEPIPDLDVRIYDGYMIEADYSTHSIYIGRIEFGWDGYYGYACPGDFEDQAAVDVVCRQRGGPPKGKRIPTYREWAMPGAIISGISCTGHETNIAQCYDGTKLFTNSCPKTESAWIVCGFQDECDEGLIEDENGYCVHPVCPDGQEQDVEGNCVERYTAPEIADAVLSEVNNLATDSIAQAELAVPCNQQLAIETDVDRDDKRSLLRDALRAANDREDTATAAKLEVLIDMEKEIHQLVKKVNRHAERAAADIATTKSDLLTSVDHYNTRLSELTTTK